MRRRSPRQPADRRSPSRPRGAGERAATLPEAELETLAALHELGEAEVREVRARLAAFRALGHASVTTLLRRLEEKGLVRRRRADHGKAFLYSAVPAADVTYGGVVRRLLARVFGGDGVALVSSLFSVSPPDRTEVERLRSLLAELERRGVGDG
jgi:predicted transcriptional regulator